MNDDSRLNVAVRMLDPDLPLPSYAREDDAGADLSSSQDLVIEPGERALVGTGVSLAIPRGYVGLVHPRSGLAHRHGLSMVNAPGTVDAGYRGEIKVNLLNCDPRDPITIRRGDRIAQLVIQKVEHAHFSPVDSLEESERGERGFGSTGVAGLT